MSGSARWILSLWVAIGWACRTSDPAPQDDPAPTPSPAAPSLPVDIGAPGFAPDEPRVVLIEPGAPTPLSLPPRTPGQERRVVVRVRISEGTHRRLHLPSVLIGGDLILDTIGDAGSRYRWTPKQSTVLSSGDGIDPQFLHAFESALEPGSPPPAVSMATDRWDAVTELPWPNVPTPYAETIGDALRLALSHSAIPIPKLDLSEGSRWEVQRRVDLFGIPGWQTLELVAQKIQGRQLEVNADVTYRLIDAEPVTGQPFGLDAVVDLTGQGQLRARYDLPSSTPVELELRSKFAITEHQGAKPRRFEVELRADEDFMARPDPRVTLHGQLTQGGVVFGVVPPGTKVWFNKKRLRVSDDGDFVLGFGRDAPARARVAFSFDQGPPERHILHIENRIFEPEAIDGLPPEMVDLDKDTRQALARSRTKIKKIRSRPSDTPFFREGFRWPVKGKITSTYGRQRILNGEDHGYHWGVDIAARPGRKIVAPAGGVVVFAERDVPLAGHLIILDHGHGLMSAFLHLQSIKVVVGDEIAPGQTIATLGNTGRSTGAHLDWRMNLFQTRVDPQTLVEPRP